MRKVRNVFDTLVLVVAVYQIVHGLGEAARSFHRHRRIKQLANEN